MIKAIAKMMVKSVPKSFENESFQIIYLQIELILH